MNEPKRNKNRHRNKKYRKNQDHRNQEVRKVIAQKPTRQKRWKDIYESGGLGDEDTNLDDDGDILFEDDPEDPPE